MTEVIRYSCNSCGVLFPEEAFEGRIVFEAGFNITITRVFKRGIGEAKMGTKMHFCNIDCFDAWLKLFDKSEKVK